MLFFADNKEESVQEILYSIQFVDEEGNIYEVDSSQTKEGCQNYDDINGTLMKHTKIKMEIVSQNIMKEKDVHCVEQLCMGAL